MAWFKFGKQDSSAMPADGPVETVEMLRTRAKRRLIGALVLVSVAVIGFPLLFDTQPRPVVIDVPIEIPDKDKVKPLVAPPPAGASAAKVEDKVSLDSKEEIVAAGSAASAKPPQVAAPAAQAATAPPQADDKVAQAAAQANQAAAEKAKADAAKADAAKAASAKAAADKEAAAKAAAAKSAAEKAAAEKAQADAAKAKALLEGKAAPASANGAADAGNGRFVVQFGSFAESAKTQEVRRKVEAAGLKTYAQVADTSEGKRHRARVGPFASRAEAEKAAAKIKALGLPAHILAL